MRFFFLQHNVTNIFFVTLAITPANSINHMWALMAVKVIKQVQYIICRAELA